MSGFNRIDPLNTKKQPTEQELFLQKIGTLAKHLDSMMTDGQTLMINVQRGTIVLPGKKSPESSTIVISKSSQTIGLGVK